MKEARYGEGQELREMLIGFLGTQPQIIAAHSTPAQIAWQRARYFEVAGPMEWDEAKAEAAKVAEWMSSTCCHCRYEFQHPVDAYRHRPKGGRLCPDCADD